MNTEVTSYCENQTLVDAIMENLGHGVVACDSDGNLTFFNKTLREWHGCDVRTIPSEQWAEKFDLYETDGMTHLPTERIPLMRAFSGEIVKDAMFYLVVKGQRPRLINSDAAPLISPEGRKIGAYAIMDDITDRLKKEREIVQAMAMLDATEDGIFICDAETLQFEYVNRGAVKQVGYSRDELLAMTPLEIKPEFDEEAYRAILDQVKKRSGRMLRFETVHRHKDGSNVPVELNFQVIAPLGERERAVVTARDVSERMKAEAMKVAKDAADEANRAKSAFLANMSHEIRTPMNAILGYTQLMKNESGLPDIARDYLDVIDRSSEHLLSLINDILDMSKVEAGMVELSLEAFDIVKLLEDIAMMFRVSTESRGLNLELELLEGLPQVIESDQSKIRQVLINLVGNAVKYTARGGVVLRACGEVYEDGAAAVVVDVEDSGEGIEEVDRESIFAAFEQTREGRRQGEGTGLGLAISRKFAEALGGSLVLQRSSGRGSVFRFSFPVTLSAEMNIPENPKPARKILRLAESETDRRILIADDRDTNRDLLLRLLQRVGYRTRTVPNGLEAVRVAREWRPNLILMDMRMPELNGLAATRQIRACPEVSEVPIVIVSASAMEENRAEALEAGANGFIRKPFREDEILEESARLIGASYLYEAEEAPASTPSDLAETKQALADILRLDQIEYCRETLEMGDVDELIRFIRAECGAAYPAWVERVSGLADRLELESLAIVFGQD